MTIKKVERRIKIKFRIRKSVNGTAERPRMSVFRSNKQIYAQIINDLTGTTLVSASSLGMEAMPKKEQAAKVGELIARVEAVLRRSGKAETEFKLFDVTINTDSRTVKKGNRSISLTVKEFDLLIELIRNKNVAMYREDLYERVWREPFLGETRTLDSHIQRLRKKLGWEDHIKTVFRIGYRLEV